jgi:GH25 family lysozyme M1 (1,4-beta-N-acetylmuramidase)
VGHGSLFWKFWQWTDEVSVEGIDGNVDLNPFNGTVNELMTFAGRPQLLEEWVRGMGIEG